MCTTCTNRHTHMHTHVHTHTHARTHTHVHTHTHTHIHTHTHTHTHTHVHTHTHTCTHAHTHTHVWERLIFLLLLMLSIMCCSYTSTDTCNASPQPIALERLCTARLIEPSPCRQPLLRTLALKCLEREKRLVLKRNMVRYTFRCAIFTGVAVLELCNSHVNLHKLVQFSCQLAQCERWLPGEVW